LPPTQNKSPLPLSRCLYVHAALVNRFRGVEGVITLHAGLPSPSSFPLTSISATSASAQAPGSTSSDLVLQDEIPLPVQAPLYGLASQRRHPWWDFRTPSSFRSASATVTTTNTAQHSSSSPPCPAPLPVPVPSQLTHPWWDYSQGGPASDPSTYGSATACYAACSSPHCHPAANGTISPLSSLPIQGQSSCQSTCANGTTHPASTSGRQEAVQGSYTFTPAPAASSCHSPHNCGQGLLPAAASNQGSGNRAAGSLQITGQLVSLTCTGLDCERTSPL